MQISGALLFQLGALLTALAVLGAVARRFALSPIPVYLLAGLSLGKGGIWPVAAAGEFIRTGAPIGVVLLLLTLGLEFSATEFASSLRHHLPSAGVDVVLNATPGAVGGLVAGVGRGRHPRSGRRHLHLLVGCHRAPVGGLAQARQPGNAGRAFGIWCSKTSRWRPTCRCSRCWRRVAPGWRRSRARLSRSARCSRRFAASFHWGHHVGRLVAASRLRAATAQGAGHHPDGRRRWPSPCTPRRPWARSWWASP